MRSFRAMRTSQRPVRAWHAGADDRGFAVEQGGWVNSQVFDHTSLIRFNRDAICRRTSYLIETTSHPGAAR